MKTFNTKRTLFRSALVYVMVFLFAAAWIPGLSLPVFAEDINASGGTPVIVSNPPVIPSPPPVIPSVPPVIPGDPFVIASGSEAIQSSDATQDDTATPGDDSVSPGGDSTTPGDIDTTQDDDSVTPGDIETTPGDNSTTPGDIETTPGDDSVIASDSEAIQDQELSAMGDIAALAGGSYGPNGKFLAPIDAPAAGSIPISSRGDLEKIGADESYPSDGNYYLTQDIDLSGAEWTPIANFTGVFDGQGYVISNMTITQAGEYGYVGLFDSIYDATVKNVGLEGTDIIVSTSSSVMAGGICAESYGSSTVSNCYMEGKISVSIPSSGADDYASADAGGICALTINGVIDNCFNSGTVSASTASASSFAEAGGVCGRSLNGSIRDCYNSGPVTVANTSPEEQANAYSAGICVENFEGVIDNCNNSGNVTASGLQAIAGGICESSYNDTDGNATISNCCNTGDVSATGQNLTVGGICAQNGASGISGTIISCYNTGAISTSCTYSSSSDIYTSVEAGGICGFNTGAISASYNTGAISNSIVSVPKGDIASAVAGGICSFNMGDISACYNNGAVSGSTPNALKNGYAYVDGGGICGVNVSGTIGDCNNTGAVSVSGSSVEGGGICALNDNSDIDIPGSIISCYNTGLVSVSCNYADPDGYASAMGGGICAYNASAVSDSCNAGAVSVLFAASSAGSSSSAICGGVCGFNIRSILDCFNVGPVASTGSTINSYAGGICGGSMVADSTNAASLKNCYNAGALSANWAGGVCAYNIVNSGTATVTNCYARNLFGSAYGRQLTDAQMKVSSNFAGFNFTNVWAIDASKNHGYPYLQGVTVVDWVDKGDGSGPAGNMIAAPAITAQPVGLTQTVGKTAKFSVTVSKPPSGVTQSFQWQKSANGGTSFSNISGATTASYTTTALKLTDDQNQYRCVVTNKKGTATAKATSDAATLRVYDPSAIMPKISAQPSSQTADAGGTATFEITASIPDGVDGTLTYQWQKLAGASWEDLADDTNIDGAMTDSLALSGLAPSDNGVRYRCVVTTTTAEGFAAQIASGVVLLSVAGDAAAPAIISQPAGATAAVGGEATFGVTAISTDGGSLSYQWFSNGTASNTGGLAISGATESAYTVSAGTAGTYYFYVVVTNTKSAGTAYEKTSDTTSDAAALTVITPFTAITLDSPALESNTMSLEIGGTESGILNATTTPARAAADDELIWTSNNPSVADLERVGGDGSDRDDVKINPDGSVNVEAKTAGSATIAAMSKYNHSVYAYCWVTVLPAKSTDEPVIGIGSDDPARALSGGRLTDNLYAPGSETAILAAQTPAKNSITLSSGTGESVKWKSSDTKVATVASSGASAGLVKYVAPGTATITATVQSGTNKGKSESVILTIRDIAPRVPVTSLTLNSKSTLGTPFTVQPTDTLDFDSLTVLKAVDSKKKEGDAAGTTQWASWLDVSGGGTQWLLKLKTGSENEGAAPLPNGTYTVTMQAKAGDAAANGDGTFTLKVTVTNTVPKATVKTPTLNTFWLDASGKITISGTNLPAIDNVELWDKSDTQHIGGTTGGVTDNFTIVKKSDGYYLSANSAFSSFTDTKKTKPTVKGVLKIYYTGFGNTDADCSKVSVTIVLKPTAPKLKLSPATLTINPLWGTAASFTVSGGLIASVSHVSATQTAFKAPALSGNTVTLTLNSYNSAKAQTFSSQLNVWLEGARTAILVKPTVKTVKETTAGSYKLSAATVTLNSTLENQSQTIKIVPGQTNMDVTTAQPVFKPGKGQTAGSDSGITVTANGANITVSVEKNTPAKTCAYTVAPNGISKPLTLTVKVNATALGAKNSSLSVSVKADKGNIDLVARGNTMRSYTPTVKGTVSAITGVTAMQSSAANIDGNGNAGYEMFDVKWNPEAKKVEVRAITGAVYQKGFSYKLKFQFALEGGNTLTTGDVAIKPAQSTVKHSIPKSTTMYQSRTGVFDRQVITIKPTSPAGARVQSASFKTNPGGAYWYYFDESAQQLHIWVKDGALVKTGKATLVFSVTYEGQGTVAVKTGGVTTQTIKPVDLKIPVTVVR